MKIVLDMDNDILNRYAASTGYDKCEISNGINQVEEFRIALSVILEEILKETLEPSLKGRKKAERVICENIKNFIPYISDKEDTSKDEEIRIIENVNKYIERI